MYGYFTAHDGEWVDGVLPRMVRRMSRKDAPKGEGERSWLLMVGQLDASKMEHLYTLTDDNKVLVLNSK